jgi:hypothetical protein
MHGLPSGESVAVMNRGPSERCPDARDDAILAERGCGRSHRVHGEWEGSAGSARPGGLREQGVVQGRRGTLHLHTSDQT